MVSPAPAVFSRNTAQSPGAASNASAMPAPMRAIASSSVDPLKEPTCSTTPSRPSASPVVRCWVRLSMDER